MPSVRVQQSEYKPGEVVVTFDGHPVCLPWPVARALGRELQRIAAQAEEHDKAQQIANDQAILWHGGIPLNLSTNSQILKEAANVAETLGGVRCTPNTGIPAIRNIPRTT